MANKILQLYFDGLITESECTEKLESMQIRGGFNVDGFTGYDYGNQAWIEYSN